MSSRSPTEPAPPALMPDHIREGTIESQVLFDDEDSRIEYFRRGGDGGTLVVTFDPLSYFWDRPPFGHEFLRKQALDVVAVRKKRENFYQPLSRETVAAALRPLTSRYRRVFSYGSSLGAYAALYFGRDEPWTVIASSPRNSTHPDYGADTWRKRVAFRHEPFDAAVRPRCRAILMYDPRDAIDRRYLDGEVLPQFPEAMVLRVPYSGHPSNQVLAEMGFLPPFVRAVLAAAPQDGWPQLQRRQARTKSAAYFQVLAQQAVQRRHIGWAEALVARSLALKPRSMLALRTQGMVRLACSDWSGARDVLEQALALAPEDPMTISLLERARQRRPLHAPSPAPPAREPCEAVHPDVLARLRERLAHLATRWFRP